MALSAGIKTAFVLGAGLGTRLRPLTDERPKPLVPIFNKPLITFAFDHLIASGIRRFVVNTHHRPEAYSRWL
ncbi:MAG: sugar phosphate nucleotidyltransferase, partial [Spartobacteria bacterium]